MIINSWKKLEIGKIYDETHGFFELNGVEHWGNIKFLVLRIATEEEYHEENMRDYGKSGPCDTDFFYEISVD